MIWWLIIAAILIIGGLALWTQGAGPTVACIGGIIVLILLVGQAHSHADPTDWIGQEKRTNAAGVLCCGRGDCKSFTVDQVKVMPDGYHFPDGEIVPFGKAAPSIDHFYWKCVWSGETKCVFAPLGAS